MDPGKSWRECQWKIRAGETITRRMKCLVFFFFFLIQVCQEVFILSFWSPPETSYTYEHTEHTLTVCLCVSVCVIVSEGEGLHIFSDSVFMQWPISRWEGLIKESKWWVAKFHHLVGIVSPAVRFAWGEVFGFVGKHIFTVCLYPSSPISCLLCVRVCLCERARGMYASPSQL